MATLNPVIVPAKALKDGKHKLRISVAHNGQLRYILTDIILDSAKEFKNGQIVKRPDAAYLNTKLRSLLQKYQTSIDSIDYASSLSCPELVYAIKHNAMSSKRTIASMHDEYLEASASKQSSKMLYDQFYKHLCRCIGAGSLMDNINYSTVMVLDKHLRKRGMSPTSVLNVMTYFKALINFATKCGYVSYKIHPFARYKLPHSEIRQAWLSVEQVKAIRDYSPSTTNVALTRDLFMLSYYLGGINMADLIEINFRGLKHLKYERKKTETLQKANKYVEFDIPEEALEIIGRRIGDDGLIKLNQSMRDRRCSNLFFTSFAKIAKDLGIETLIYYSARKSFSQHAFELGISESVIDYILGHKLGNNKSCLYSYIKVTPELATEAIHKVLENLKK